MISNKISPGNDLLSIVTKPIVNLTHLGYVISVKQNANILSKNPDLKMMTEKWQQFCSGSNVFMNILL